MNVHSFPVKTSPSFCLAPLFLALLLTPPSSSWALDTGTPAPSQRVEILGTQLLRIHSSIVDQDYDLYVNIPRNYSDTTRTFPVLYLLDAQWDFPLVNGLYGGQYYDGFVPDVIIVGITWAGPHPNYDSLRTRDYTPTSITQIPYAGNASKFLAFIKNELIPFISTTYRVDKTDRGLMGSSLGGLFTLFAMFRETTLFTRYVLTSPAVTWDNGALYRVEQDYHAKHTQLPVKLFMAIGGLEGTNAAFGRLVDLLKSRDYAGLQMETRILEGMGHSGSKPEGFVRGLQSVFARPTVKLNPSVLEKLSGRYRLNPDVVLDIVAENDHLVLITPDKMRVILEAESENGFHAKGMYLLIEFHRDSVGGVTGARIEPFEGSFEVKKEG
jgi:predicted alpha/beta superfamily hydrolase